ncbi:MAG: glycosyltransferase family 4 protein, partial [Bacteroidales bacterium]|nr:glycosyltransferase family 4 protein [Bacteroidales bacterium]
MKIVYLITGSGGSFYCGNCYRDMIYLKAIRKVPGITATAIPLYLPPDETNIETGLDTHVFFGAITMYLREKVPFFRNMPVFLDKFFDSAPMLKMAARRAGTTRTEGLEDMTLSMIKGENAFPEKELQRLIKYLTKDGKPDIIHLSNALIIGLARQLKKRLDVKIVCSLLNEDDWIDEMVEPYQSKAWKLISQEAVNVDTFITPSKYYKKLFISKTGVSGVNFHIIPLAIDAGDSNIIQKKDNYPALGYFCRINSQNGFDKLVDAFIELKTGNCLPGLTLHVSGGYTGDDKSFIAEQIKKIKTHGLKSFIRIYPEFQGNSKQEFFSNIDIMSVPVRKHDGYGLYILEANAADIPVVQPATGAFPEILEMTMGGITYSPDTVAELSANLLKLFKDSNLRAQLGSNGREKVNKELSLDKMSDGLSEVYNSITKI